MEKVLTFVIQNWDAIAGIVGTVLAWLLARPIIAEKRAKADEWIRQNNLNRAMDIASGVVAEVYRTTVRGLKESETFDNAAKARIAADAATAIREQLSANGLAMLQALAPALVEMAVNRLKADAKPASVADGPEFPE